MSIVRPLHKKCDKTNMSNHRPILLLTTFSKVIENVMHNRISHYLKANNILVPEQSSFRKGISTENAAFKLTDCILKLFHQKMHVGEILCGLAKAHACVNH
jgi:shikimate kinase